MNMEVFMWVSSVLNGLVLIGLILIVTFRKYLSSYLSQKAKNLAQKEDIDKITEIVEDIKSNHAKELEEFKNELNRELELLKIDRTQVTIHKTEQILECFKFFRDFLSNDEKTNNRFNSKKEMKKINDKFVELAVKLFFFAGDNVVKRFLNFRLLVLKTGSESNTLKVDEKKLQMELLKEYGKLFAELRIDLGYKDTECDYNDFLNLTLKDWYIHQEEQEKLSLDN